MYSQQGQAFYPSKYYFLSFFFLRFYFLYAFVVQIHESDCAASGFCIASFTPIPSCAGRRAPYSCSYFPTSRWLSALQGRLPRHVELSKKKKTTKHASPETLAAMLRHRRFPIPSPSSIHRPKLRSNMPTCSKVFPLCATTGLLKDHQRHGHCSHRRHISIIPAIGCPKAKDRRPEHVKRRGKKGTKKLAIAESGNVVPPKWPSGYHLLLFFISSFPQPAPNSAEPPHPSLDMASDESEKTSTRLPPLSRVPSERGEAVEKTGHSQKASFLHVPKFSLWPACLSIQRDAAVTSLSLFP